MAKILFILMPLDFQDTEFNVPYTAFKNKGYTVDVAGLQAGEATGNHGLKFTPNLVLSNMQDSDFYTYDAVVIPGGPGSTTYLWGNKIVQDVVRYFHSKKKLVATICYACVVPAQAGLLTGKKATVYPTDEAKEIFARHNVNFVLDGCVPLKEDKIITAQSPKFAHDFADAIIQMLLTK